MYRYEEQELSRSNVNSRLNRNTCYGAEVAHVQCKRGLSQTLADSTTEFQVLVVHF